MQTLLLTVSRDGAHGRGEAAGVDYCGETIATISAQLEEKRSIIEQGLDRQKLLQLLPPGGARNALDCALWDLEAALGSGARRELALDGEALTTAMTISLDSADRMATAARDAKHCPLLKVKLNAEQPVDLVAAIRAVRPDARLIVDANAAWNRRQLDEWAPRLAELGVAMIEQPLPVAEDGELHDYAGPVPLCADESCATADDLPALPAAYRFINIKLDKSGGLTAALDLLRQARARGLELMVGNMIGTSLAMAPAVAIARHCRYVDLDGPLLLAADREAPIRYDGALMSAPPAALWCPA